jgi:hypothetical protein
VKFGMNIPSDASIPSLFCNTSVGAGKSTEVEATPESLKSLYGPGILCSNRLDF